MTAWGSSQERERHPGTRNQIIVYHLTLQDDHGKDCGVIDCELRELSKEEGGGWIGREYEFCFGYF